MTTLVFDAPTALLTAVDTKLGPTDWLEITQARIDLFANATGDHQWIHVDPERAKTGPFGGTIAHGYLTLSLVNYFLPQLLDVRGISAGVNVGVDRLRFLNPVKTGKRVRATGEIKSAEALKGGIQSVVHVIIEIEGEEKPACLVDTISRYYQENTSNA